MVLGDRLQRLLRVCRMPAQYRGQLVWEYPFWSLSFKGVWLIFFLGYFIFFIACYYSNQCKNYESQTDNRWNNIRRANFDEYSCIWILGLEILKAKRESLKNPMFGGLFKNVQMQGAQKAEPRGVLFTYVERCGLQRKHSRRFVPFRV